MKTYCNYPKLSRKCISWDAVFELPLWPRANLGTQEEMPFIFGNCAQWSLGKGASFALGNLNNTDICRRFEEKILGKMQIADHAMKQRQLSSATFQNM